MFDVVDFSTWKEYDGFAEGSGRSEKIWLNCCAKVAHAFLSIPTNSLIQFFLKRKALSVIFMLWASDIMQLAKEITVIYFLR